MASVFFAEMTAELKAEKKTPFDFRGNLPKILLESNLKD